MYKFLTLQFKSSKVNIMHVTEYIFQLFAEV